MSSIITSVLVVFAMEAEAKPLLSKLGLVKDEPSKLHGPAPCVTYSGYLSVPGQETPLEVHVVWNGKCVVNEVDCVGTVPASLASYLAIQAFKPDLVISAGTAGGFESQGAALGEIFVSSGTINHDRRIQISGSDKYGLGKLSSPPCPALIAALGLKLGVVSSGNSLDYTDQCMSIMGKNGVAVKEMEAAAIAWVCSLSGTPMICVKAITDIVDGGRPSHDEFLENLSTAAGALQVVVPKVLEFVAGKTVAQL